jgi:hypothetical protein
MASPASDARLEEFVERATSAASARAGRRLDWAPKDHDGFWTFHCPLPGPEHDPHQWRGGPRARAKLIGGRIQAGCTKCTGGKFDETYVAQVLEAIGQGDNVAHVEFGEAHSRRHHYVTCDDRYEVQHTKLTFKDRRKKPLWLWKIRDRNGGFFAGYESFEPREFCAAHYPELKSFYLALRLYGFDRFKPSAAYRVVITEGERDADTFNALMADAGEEGWIATTLPIPAPKALSLHQRVVLAGRDVVLIGDADEGGERFVAAWHKAISDVAQSVRVLPPEALELTSPGKDLSDHVEQQEGGGRTRAAIAKRLLGMIAALQVAEPPARTDWRDQLLKSKAGGVKSDSIGNAEIVLTQHPELAGRIRRDIRLGEAEIIDPPWGEASLRGTRVVAPAICSWLERIEDLSIAPRALEEALNFASVAPPYNPFEELAEVAGDPAALDDLFVRYMPLKASRAVAVKAARTFWADFARKLRGDLAPQRVLIAIATGKPLDLAPRLAGARGLIHSGSLGQGHLATFARHGMVLVQIGLDAVYNQRTAPSNLSVIFAPYTFNAIAQRGCPTPLFVAVGAMPGDRRTEQKADERVITLNLEEGRL